MSEWELERDRQTRGRGGGKIVKKRHRGTKGKSDGRQERRQREAKRVSCAWWALLKGAYVT